MKHPREEGRYATSTRGRDTRKQLGVGRGIELRGRDLARGSRAKPWHIEGNLHVTTVTTHSDRLADSGTAPG
jgi:hypothetical protein